MYRILKGFIGFRVCREFTGGLTGVEPPGHNIGFPGDLHGKNKVYKGFLAGVDF